MLPSPGLGEEGVERVVPCTDRLVGGHLTIRLNSMLQTIEFPAGVANLTPGLTDVDGDALTLKQRYVGNFDSSEQIMF